MSYLWLEGDYMYIMKARSLDFNLGDLSVLFSPSLRNSFCYSVISSWPSLLPLREDMKHCAAMEWIPLKYKYLTN
jgi:hypothetical protein